jgi:hypothetical protein
VPELVAGDRDDYLGIANRLAADPDWRRALAERIHVGHASLFDVSDAIEAFQTLLETDALPV